MWVSWGKHLETATCGFYMILACFLADFYHKPASDFFAGFLMCFPCIPATSTGTGHQGRCRFSCAGSKDKHQRNHEQIWLVETSGLEKKAVYFRWNDVDSAWFWMNSDCECVVFSLSNDPCPNIFLPCLLCMNTAQVLNTCLEIPGQDVVESVERIPLTAVELNHYLVWKPSWCWWHDHGNLLRWHQRWNETYWNIMNDIAREVSVCPQGNERSPLQFSTMP